MNIKGLLEGTVAQSELLNNYNATIIYETLPKKVDGFVFNYDNINFIIIEKNLSEQKKKKTILHELAHIELNQLNQIDKDIAYLKIDEYEDEADRYINFILENIIEYQSINEFIY